MKLEPSHIRRNLQTPGFLLSTLFTAMGAPLLRGSHRSEMLNKRAQRNLERMKTRSAENLNPLWFERLRLHFVCIQGI